MGRGVPYRNVEGYPDPTAHKAINNAIREERRRDARARRAMENLRRLADELGFEIVNRIELRDRYTGKIFK
ncbi:MAG: hypothetical protein IJ153_05415 [Clostridia bacterium]|nr:hypothetical protein [Clostridia bacterium]